MVCSALREDHSPMCGVNQLEVLRRLHLLDASPCAAQQFDHAVGVSSYLLIRMVVVVSGTGRGEELGSWGSWPASTPSARAASSTLHAITPPVSRVQDTGTAP